MFEIVGGMLYISKVNSKIKTMHGWQKYGKKSITEVFVGAGRMRMEELLLGVRVMQHLKLTPEQAARVLMMVDNADLNLTIKAAIITHIKAVAALTGINCDDAIGVVQSMSDRGALI
jgi:hypothetical protein